MLVSIVPASAGGLNIMRYIQRAWPLLPVFALRDAFKKRDVKVNGSRVSSEEILKGGDEVRVYLPERYSPVPPESIFEDENLTAFIKPAGLPVDTDAEGIGEDTVLKRLQMKYPSARLVHRLDAGTAGVMLAALNEKTEKALTNAFSAHKLEKHYSALVLGRMPKKQDTLRAYLDKDADSARVRVTEKETPFSKPIETRYRVVREFSENGVTLSVLDVEIPTGRTHQIRAHLAYIDHPLAGDDKYGNRQANRTLGRMQPCLQCVSIKIGACEGLEDYENMRFQTQFTDWKQSK